MVKFIFFIFLLFIYFLPTIIAVRKEKPNAGAIFVLNLFLGWTFIGWIVSLVWSLASNYKPQAIVVNNNVLADRTINPIVPQPSQESNNIDLKPHALLESSIVKVHDEKIKQLQQLKQLLDSGVLTQEEFTQQKSKVLKS